MRWTEISEFPEMLTDVIKMNVNVTTTGTGKKIVFYQFPIKLSYAVTVHKAKHLINALYVSKKKHLYMKH